jgi:serine/threonine protein phosphatase 1
MKKELLKLNLTDARKVFVVGDIHGGFTYLEWALRDVGFDKHQDKLLSVGDLVDRGPESDKVLDYLNESWFYAIGGNHEEMALDPSLKRVHRSNGGKWLQKLYYKDQRRYWATKGALNALPIAIEALLPSGKRIGLVHADYPNKSWNDIEHVIATKADELVWSRKGLKYAEEMARLGFEFDILDIDHIYYGHTPLPRPWTWGNQSWIDTEGWVSGFEVIEVT